MLEMLVRRIDPTPIHTHIQFIRVIVLCNIMNTHNEHIQISIHTKIIAPNDWMEVSSFLQQKIEIVAIREI